MCCSGFYADTGFNFGKQGGRAVIFGIGIDWAVKEKEEEDAKMSFSDLSGVGITLPTFKARLGWSKAKAEDAAADPAVATGA